jgi:hypothetical protein
MAGSAHQCLFFAVILLAAVASSHAAPLASMRMPLSTRFNLKHKTGSPIGAMPLLRTNSKPTIEYFTHDVSSEDTVTCMRLR